MSPKWWDEGRADYAPNNPFLNINMIWIAGFAPMVVGVPIVALIQWLCP